MEKRIVVILFCLASLSSYSQEFTFVFLHKKSNPTELPKEQLDKIMEGHMANITRLAKEKKLAAAGPFEGGGGIFIFRSKSKKEVEDWLNTDPGIQAKRWDVEIQSYSPRVGSVCSVGEPYEMVLYNFVRYTLNTSKDTYGMIAEGMKDHQQYIKELSAAGNIITEASFGDDEGSILIMKGEISKELIEKDPAVQKQVMTAELKKLYIAKGSFCEK